MLDMEELYKEYFSAIYKYLYDLSHNEEIAEELTQETFCRALKTLNKFRGQCKVNVWLCQIAKYTWYERFKKEKRIKNIEMRLTFDENIELAELGNTIEEHIIEQEYKEKIYDSIKKMDETTKRVMLYRINANMSFKEIGLIMGKSENWARVNFYRGKEKILRKEKIDD